MQPASALRIPPMSSSLDFPFVAGLDAARWVQAGLEVWEAWRMTPAQLAASRQQRLVSLLRHARTASPFYRAAARGSPARRRRPAVGVSGRRQAHPDAGVRPRQHAPRSDPVRDRPVRIPARAARIAVPGSIRGLDEFRHHGPPRVVRARSRRAGGLRRAGSPALPRRRPGAIVAAGRALRDGRGDRRALRRRVVGGADAAVACRGWRRSCAPAR